MVWRCCFDFRFRCSRYNGPFFSLSLSRILPLSSNQVPVQYLFILSSMGPCLMGIEVTLSWTNILHQAFSNIFYSFESSIEQRCSIAMNKKKRERSYKLEIHNEPTSKIDNRSFGRTCFWLEHSSFQSTQFIDILAHKY